MCAVHGWMTFDGKTQPVPEIVSRALVAGAARGRDSFGVATEAGRWTHKGQVTQADVPTEAAWLISNNRAEPTTEWVEELTGDDIQPFVFGETTVAHNGTIANDAYLAQLLQYERPTKVDSVVLAPLLDGADFRDACLVASRLSLVVGSYGLVAQRGGVLLAATNYRPMSVHVIDEVGVLFTSLSEQQLGISWSESAAGRGLTAVPPYSTVALVEGQLTGPVSSRVPLAEKSLVVCSGGMDSVTVATQTVRRIGAENVRLLHFQYGCPAEERELEAVNAVSDRLGLAKPIVVGLGDLFTQYAQSALVRGDTPATGESGAEYAFEWVPARNLVMLAVATAVAEAEGFNKIALGINIEEAGSYPDNEQEFVRLLNQVMPYSVNVDASVGIDMPVGHLSKREIVQLGVRVGAPLDLAWSCYKGGAVHCGDCGPCFMRSTAHAMAGVADSVEYMGD